jgi:hypothetical protein
VHVLSTTSHPLGDGPASRRVRGGGTIIIPRPPPVGDYQLRMSGVDRCMQLRAKNPVGRPAKKYWKYFVNYFIELSLINAFLIWKETPGTRAAKKSYSLMDFSLDVARQLIGNFSSRRDVVVRDRAIQASHTCIRMASKRTRCSWCPKHGTKQRKTTVYGCLKCEVHLCKGSCFEAYHQHHTLLH